MISCGLQCARLDTIQYLDIKPFTCAKIALTNMTADDAENSADMAYFYHKIFNYEV